MYEMKDRFVFVTIYIGFAKQLRRILTLLMWMALTCTRRVRSLEELAVPAETTAESLGAMIP